MSNLSLIFKEFPAIKICDFTNIPADFVKNDSFLTVSMCASGLGEVGQRDSLTLRLDRQYSCILLIM
ncbi:MAG: hypothetical protein JSV97_05080 [candidate division WOR-3 bacterium]|nr:MAG: hypothetical protein JSV97_05080 [candidate division WOR-3 bacterium]